MGGQRKIQRKLEVVAKKKQDDFFKGKSDEEKKMFLLINSELELISFLLNRHGEKEKVKIFEEASAFTDKEECPVVFHNLVQLLKLPAPKK